MHILGNTLVLITSFLSEGVIAHTAPPKTGTGSQKEGRKSGNKTLDRYNVASRTPIFRIYRTEEHCTPLQGTTVHFKLSTGTIFISRQKEPTSTHPNFTNFLFSPCIPLLPITSQQLHIGHALITLLTNTVLHDPREQMRRRFHPLLQFHPAGKIKIHSASKISLASPATHTPSSTKIWLPVVPYVPEPTNPPFQPTQSTFVVTIPRTSQPFSNPLFLSSLGPDLL